MADSIRRGAVAGLIAAAAVAVFFMVLDAIVGEPMRTPTYLAGQVLGMGEGAGAVALYTVLHFLVFTLIGVFIAALLERTRIPPVILLGFVVGVLLFDLVFYLTLVVRGVDILEYLGWPAFLAGNLVGGLALMGWLDWKSDDTLSWGDFVGRHQLVREGLITGFIGAVVVALWFAVVDLTTREFFFTPAALGSAVFQGARGVGEVEISAMNVAGYTILHVLSFIAVGLIAAYLATHAERNGVVILGAVLLFVTFETLFLGLSAIAASWLLAALNGWTILGANLVAAGAMGIYLWRAHPGLRAQLGSDVEEKDFETVRP